MLNDDIIAYLNGKGIAFTGADFQTGIPEGGVDQIMRWDADKLGPQPTADVLAAAGQAAQEMVAKEANKKLAMSLLQETDWTEMPSVSDPSVTPHLTNKDEFVAYRAALRAIAVDPPVVTVSIPSPPAEQWQT